MGLRNLQNIFRAHPSSSFLSAPSLIYDLELPSLVIKPVIFVHDQSLLQAQPLVFLSSASGQQLECLKEPSDSGPNSHNLQECKLVLAQSSVSHLAYFIPS